MLIRPTLPYKTLAEFIAAAKQQPGKFNYASAGLGNWTHLFMAYLNSQAGIDQVNVVYRSGAEMLTALLRNEADTAIITVSTSLGQIKEGKDPRARRRLDAADAATAGHAAGRADHAAASTSASGTASPRRPAWIPRSPTRINGVFNQVLQVPTVRTRSPSRRPPTSSAARRSSSTPSSRAS